MFKLLTLIWRASETLDPLPRDPKKVVDTMRKGRARRVENLLGGKIAAKAGKVNLRLKTDKRGKGAENTKVLELVANQRVKEIRVARESRAAKGSRGMAESRAAKVSRGMAESRAAKGSRGMAESQAAKVSRKKENRLPASRENLKA